MLLKIIILERNGTLMGDPAYVPGVINPKNVSSVKKAISIDSRFRNNYYNTSSSDFTVDLPLKLNNVIDMRISNFEIPKTYYLISDYLQNNKFMINQIQLFHSALLMEKMLNKTYLITILMAIIH